ncbi:MAG: tetratricopeptide repeat protein [Zoogloeaceae bacterium]|jgi:type III secretion system low calcium response chaperone LcrH/SycD|nr:tetratricopeptide repeat protein [Zoogloeaceae bacterium]
MPAAQPSSAASPDLREIAAMLALGGENGACVMQEEHLEALYALGRRLLATGEFMDAVTVFIRLCLHEHGSRRFWMGLGSSLQEAGNLEKAIDAYGMAGLCGALDDPEPFYHIALCHLELKRNETAIQLLDAIARIDENNGATHASLRENIAGLRKSLVMGVDENVSLE